MSIFYKNRKVIGDLYGNEDKTNVFFLHGAGKSNRKRFDLIRLKLENNGISSCAFDFIGHGETGGNLSSSSLIERTEVASCIIDKAWNGKPITLIGASMSGYTAVKLQSIYNVKNLVLLVPAAYDKKAYKLNFDLEFTRCIRTLNSYYNSDAWELLNGFKGKALIVNAEKDKVIPNEVIELFYTSASQAKRELLTINNSPHGLLEFLSSNEAQLNLLTSKLVELINNQ